MRPSSLCRNFWTGYGLALLGVLAVLGLRWGLDPILEPQALFIIMLPAVVFAAWSAGLGPGIFALLLGGWLLEYFFSPPRFSVAVHGEDNLIKLVIYLATGSVCIGLIESLHRSRRSLIDAMRDLSHERRRTNVTLDSIGDGVIATDREGRVTYINRVAEALTGWSVEEAHGKHISAIFLVRHLDDKQPAQRGVDDVLERQDKTTQETGILVGRDGRHTPVEHRTAPIRDPQNQVHGVVVAFRDLTEEQAAEAAVLESESRFRIMADTAPVLIWMARPDKLCDWFNKAWLEFTGRTMQDEYGDGWIQDVHPDDRQRCMDMYVDAFDRREPFQMEYRLRRHDGEYRWLFDHGVPRFAPGGEFMGYIGSCIDVTDRKQAEQSLLAMNETLEQRVEERTAEAERRTRQLRALAAELAQVEQAERRRLAQTLHDHLQQLLVAGKLTVNSVRERIEDHHCRTGIERVEELLDQCIAASRSLTIELSPPILYDRGLAAALDWLARMMQEKHNLVVECAIVEPVEPAAEHVRYFLFQAVRELLFNIVKHAGSNRARITLGRAEDDRIKIVVEDFGKGFDVDAAAEDPKSFERFGLFNIRERMLSFGGSLEIVSNPGRGTRATLCAPLDKPDAGAVTAPGAVAVSKDEIRQLAKDHGNGNGHGRIRVLLADDHLILREGIAERLRGLADIELVGEASDGIEAVELTRRLRPDVVIMDISMPRMNGVDATRIITADLPDVRVVGLSMHQKEDMAAAMREAGAAAYVTKDGPSELLIKAIRDKN